MVRSFFLILLFSTSLHWSYAQEQQTTITAEQLIINLSKEKWQWMADKNVTRLATLFHDKSKFVHMSGTWKKDEELEIIKSGSIWYKKADVHDTALELFEDTALLWSRITLLADVRGNEVTTQFTVTEVFKKEGDEWKILALTFSSVRDSHVIKH
ncbi:MAG TPA: nuclear transport factor 2 family protein [Ohtaekwangia sp.]